jgi:hypothetical protein
MPMLEQNLDAVKALVNKEVVEQKLSIHCHSRISSINANALAELGRSEGPC